MAPHCSAVKVPSRAALAAEMGAHRWSRAIAKGPPRKIRIVHVEEPKVIKTDAREFRELVQRLTGKPRGGGGGGGGSGAPSSSSSAEIAASESSSSQASGGSSSDRAVVALAAVKAEVEEEEGGPASPEVEGLAQAFGEVLGDTNDGAARTPTVRAEVKEEGDAAWTPEDEGFARGVGEYDAFFHGLDDFLLGAFQPDGSFSL